jgi:hypothetical protein
MPETSPFTSARNTDTPAADSCSARIWSVRVLPGAGGTRDQPVPVHHLQGRLDDRLVHRRPVVHALAELDGLALGRVRPGDGLPEVRHAGESSRDAD